MYADYRPPQCSPECPQRVLVIEVDKDFPCDVDAVVAEASFSTTPDFEGDDPEKDKIFWIVYSDNPGRAWDSTERAFRSDLRTRNKQARGE